MNFSAIKELERQWHAQAKLGKVREVHAEMLRTFTRLLHDFRIQFNPPGVRYWELYALEGRGRQWVSTAPGETFTLPTGYTAVEINHLECVTRERNYRIEQARIQDEDDEL